MGNFKIQMKLIALAALLGATNAAVCDKVTAVEKYDDDKCATKTATQPTATELTAAVKLLNDRWVDTCTNVATKGSWKYSCTDDGISFKYYSEADACTTEITDLTADPGKALYDSITKG